MLTLVITGPDQASRTEQLEPGTTTIGRSDSNGIVLNHANVSRNHAEVRVDDSGAQVSDAGSANGTRLNGRKLEAGEWAALRADDRIDIGVFSMQVGFQADGPETVYLDRTVFAPKVEAARPIPPTPAAPPPAAVMPTPSPAPPPLPPAPPAPPVVPVAVPVASHEATPRPSAARPRPASASGLPTRQREKLALVLLVLAALLTLPASFATWDQRVLLNQDRFVKVGNDVLGEPAVQKELARQLAVEIDSTSSNDLLKDLGVPDLGIPDEIAKTGLDILDSILGTGPSKQPTKPGAAPARGATSQLVEEIMLEVIQALPNTPIAETALVATHKGLMTAIRNSAISTNNDAIVIDIGDGMTQLFGTANILGVTPAQFGPDFGKIEIAKTKESARTLNLARRLDGLYLPLIAVVVLAMAGSVYLAPDRPRHVTRAGIAMIIAAVLWIGVVLVPMKPWVLDQAVQDSASRPAADAAYGVVAGSFVNQEIYLVVAGVALLVAGLFLTARAAREAAAPVPPPEVAST